MGLDKDEEVAKGTGVLYSEENGGFPLGVELQGFIQPPWHVLWLNSAK
jgi:hypothetical protein